MRLHRLQDRMQWQDRVHFFAVSAQLMRHMVDHARRRNLNVGAVSNTSIEDAAVVTDDTPVHLVGLNDALDALGQLDARKARVVELRFFGGLSVEETAAVLKVSSVTVMRDWSGAKTWLYREPPAESVIDPERWQQITACFRQPSCSRTMTVTRSEAGMRDDHVLEREVRSLLSAHRHAGAFLDSPAMAIAARALAREQPDDIDSPGDELVWPRHLPLSSPRQAGTRWHGRGLQGRGHASPQACRSQVPVS